MKDLIYGKGSIRAVNHGKGIWFVVKDICEIFEFPNFRDWLLKQEQRYFRLLAVSDRHGRLRKTWVVNQAGLYRLMKKVAPHDGSIFARWLINESRAEPMDQKLSEPEAKLTHGAALQVIEERDLLGKDFRMYGTVDEPMFLAKDVATWIEHSQVSKMLSELDQDEKLMGTIFLSGQNREAWFLTEDGLYEVLMQSRKPIAKEFKKRVKDILRSIRRTGGFGAIHGYPIPADLEGVFRMAANLAGEVSRLHEANAQLVAAIEEQASIMESTARSCRGYTRILLEKGGVRLGGGVGDGLVGENA